MRLHVLLAVLCILLTGGPVAAQVPTGTISGRVLDQAGQAVPGVSVTATSPNLQGERSAVTSELGDYVLPLLPPGTYEVRFELAGFESVTRTIAVAPTQTVPTDVTLAVARISESVTVTADASAFVNTAQVATNIRQDLTSTLPTSRTLVAAVLLAPNVKASGPGGTTGGDGALMISGATSYDSLYLVNGVAVTENLRGQPFTLFIEDALQETTVTTAGVSAEYGRFGGGLVNAVTRSGGNRFSASFRNSFNNDNWRTTTPFNETKLDKTIPTYEYTAGGPVIRDSLWFFTAGRIRTSEDARQTFITNVAYPRTDEERRYEGKLTYTATPNHTVRGAYLKINQQIVNTNFQNVMDVRSLFNQGQPQDLLSLNYNGIAGSSLTIEGQYSQRHFSITGAGANATDLINGTLLVDRSRGGSAYRYWAATFCGVCGDEARDNSEMLAKGTYFLSSERLGTHTVAVGYDFYNDHRAANNHQSGSDYRILGTSTVIRGTDIYPVFLPNSTTIQWNPIALSSNGTDLQTHSLFLNDSWRASARLTVNLGVRWDRNAGEDAANQAVSSSSAFSPRLGVVFDPVGDGRWSVSTSFARYVSALSSAIAENSPAGNPADYTWAYQGPAINPDPNAASLLGPADAIEQVFDWFNANGGTDRAFLTAEVPGVNTFVGEHLASPGSYEYAAGVSRAFGRGSVRADYVFRDFRDFYVKRTDLTTGQVTDALGTTFDVALIENSNDLTRRYQGGTFQGTYRLAGGTEIGGSYTVSRLWGNIEGETSASGPVPSGLFSYPEYREARWNAPEGNLAGDQRHRGRLWGVYRAPLSPQAGTIDLGLLFTAASGVPYGGYGTAVGAIDPRPYVTNPGYATPLGSDDTVDYFFFPRDRYRTEAQYRTDLSMNYAYRFVGGLEAFFHGEVLNLFNQFQLCGCGGTVFNNGGGADLRTIGTSVVTAFNTSTLQPFNPFTDTPVEGVNYRRAANFGTAVNRFAYTTPRTFRFSVGVRF